MQKLNGEALLSGKSQHSALQATLRQFQSLSEI
jgi:hypothetical protein